jgi:hypothetical protein
MHAEMAASPQVIFSFLFPSAASVVSEEDAIESTLSSLSLSLATTSIVKVARC